MRMAAVVAGVFCLSCRGPAAPVPTTDEGAPSDQALLARLCESATPSNIIQELSGAADRKRTVATIRYFRGHGCGNTGPRRPGEGMDAFMEVLVRTQDPVALAFLEDVERGRLSVGKCWHVECAEQARWLISHLTATVLPACHKGDPAYRKRCTGNGPDN